MKLFHWTCPGGNFGDDLNPWLWPRVAPEIVDNKGDDLFVGIGTLLSDILPAEPHKHVFGSGAWKGKPLPVLDDRITFHCVRGPLTARLLGLHESVAITDPAILVAGECAEAIVPREDIGVAYMPHHRSSMLGDWESICDLAGCAYVDPGMSVEATLNAIASSKFLITEAMHGAIVADALRVPWIPVKAYSHILEFKWEDWCSSMKVAYRPQRLPSVWREPESSSVWKRAYSTVKKKVVASGLRKVARMGRTSLSEDTIHSQRIDELWTCLAKLRDSVLRKV